MSTQRNEAIAFFLANGGSSYDPLTETREQGRQRCAEAFADAEAWGKAAGLHFEWEQDHADTSEFRDDVTEQGEPDPHYMLQACVARLNSIVVASLSGIDPGAFFTRDDPYIRVIEAELALEVQGDVEARRAEEDAFIAGM